MNLEEQFHERMLRLCIEARPVVGNLVSPLRASISSLRGLGAAKVLLYAAHVTTGFEELWRKGRLDLSVEAIVLEPEWAELFTDYELGIARERLEGAGYH